jgi:hypothetical protein
MNSLIDLKTIVSILVVSIFGNFALLPSAQAVLPAPDGGYPGGNTAEGQSALFSLTSGTFNTAVGLFSLRSNTEGNFNTAVGAGTLLANTAGNNTATGAGALLSNTIGEENTASGAFALFTNTEGLFNTATGFQALFSNTIGAQNTACGDRALFSNTTGNFNTATGDGALASNTTGGSNTAIGINALANKTTGLNNTAVGAGALAASSTGDGNAALGVNAGSNVTTASNVICIGSGIGGANVNNSCFIGHIRDVVVAPDAAQVLIDSTGKLGTTTGSSRRFKKEIKLMDKASEALLALKPVTFHYKSDGTNTPQFGLIAEEVAEVNPDLVVRDKDGEIYTVRYDAVNAMLLNEFLKAHRTLQELKKEISVLSATVKEQDSRIQEVSAQLETSKSAPQVVLNSP